MGPLTYGIHIDPRRDLERLPLCLVGFASHSQLLCIASHPSIRRHIQHRDDAPHC